MVMDAIARALALQATKNDMTLTEKQQLIDCDRDRHSHYDLNAIEFSSKKIINRFVDEIEPNKSYICSTDSDFTITLPEINLIDIEEEEDEWLNKDIQSVLYLHCENDIDVQINSTTLYNIGNDISTTAGDHVLLFIYNPIIGWVVGSFDIEE